MLRINFYDFDKCKMHRNSKDRSKIATTSVQCSNGMSPKTSVIALKNPILSILTIFL